MRIEWIGAGSLMATAALAGGCAPVPSEDTTELGSSVQALSQTLYSEGFETGQPQLFYDAACTIDTAASASGTYGMACDDTASVTVPVSTAGATNLTLGYTVETTRYESSEQLIVETSLDSVEWEPLQTLSGVNSQTSYAFELGPQFEGGQLTVRFHSTANGWLEKFYLDDIYVTAEVTPDPCDGIDNDQDGQVDEDFVPEPTSCGIGACNRDGMTTCDDGVLGDSCMPGQPAASDALCDEVDEDCDGVVDEDADCSA